MCKLTSKKKTVNSFGLTGCQINHYEYDTSHVELCTDRYTSGRTPCPSKNEL